MKAIYVGGLGIDYKKKIVKLKQLNPGGVDLDPANILFTSQMTQYNESEIALKLGRLGHTAMYRKDDNSIYIFGGQQELLGAAGSTNSVRDLQNDLWRLELNTGLYEKVDLQNSGAIPRRIYATGFIISQYFFIMGGMGIDGACLNDVLMFDTERRKCKVLN